MAQELGAVTLKELKIRAAEAGVDKALIDDADGAEDAKAEVLRLIMERELVIVSPLGDVASPRARELEQMKPSALQRRAQAAGVSAEDIEKADDAVLNVCAVDAVKNLIPLLVLEVLIEELCELVLREAARLIAIALLEQQGENHLTFFRGQILEHIVALPRLVHRGQVDADAVRGGKLSRSRSRTRCPFGPRVSFRRL